MNIDKKYAKTQRAQLFLKSEEGMSAYNELCRLVEDEEYNTTSTFSPSATDGNLLFIDKHMNYLCSTLVLVQHSIYQTYAWLLRYASKHRLGINP